MKIDTRRVVKIAVASSALVAGLLVPGPVLKPSPAIPESQESRLDPSDWGAERAGRLPPEFAGGDECLFCHRATVGGLWQNDAHFRSIRERFSRVRVAPEIEALKAHPEYGRFGDEAEFVLGSNLRVRFLRRGENGRFDLLGAGMRPGAPGSAARFVTGDEKSWQNGKFSEKCIGCHMTGVHPSTLRPFETFVGCEACHGPLDEGHTSGASFMILARKARDAPRVIASACGQCHLRGGRSRSSGRPFASGFVSGDNLFRDLEFDFDGPDDPGQDPLDAHIRRNIRDIVILGKDDLTCVSCHRMHPSSTQFHRRRPKIGYCYVCHRAEPHFDQTVQYQRRSAVCEY